MAYSRLLAQQDRDQSSRRWRRALLRLDRALAARSPNRIPAPSVSARSIRRWRRLPPRNCTSCQAASLSSALLVMAYKAHIAPGAASDLVGAGDQRILDVAGRVGLFGIVHGLQGIIRRGHVMMWCRPPSAACRRHRSATRDRSSRRPAPRSAIPALARRRCPPHGRAG